MTKHNLSNDDYVLEDDYPVNFEYLYIVDGVLVRSNIEGTVSDLKRSLKAKEVRRYSFKFDERKQVRIGDTFE